MQHDQVTVLCTINADLWYVETEDGRRGFVPRKDFRIMP